MKGIANWSGGLFVNLFVIHIENEIKQKEWFISIFF